MSTLSKDLLLPCGITIPNRLAKAALTENLADPATNEPNLQHHRLYKEWGSTGIGLLISGNVMIDRRFLESPGNVVIEDDRNLAILSKIANDAQENGSVMFVQLSHPGRQCPISVCLTTQPVAPSDLPPVNVILPIFRSARELQLEEIQDIIKRFGVAAEVVKRAGFSGVQLHGAHGYLISQFNSPLYNKRTDRYGGNSERNRQFLLDVYREVRRIVGQNFPISVKLNSADFQKGGFTEEESIELIEILEKEGVDLLEVSGGNYESAEFMGMKKESTRKREAFFIDFCQKVRKTVKKLPLMLTGGMRSKTFMESAINNGEVDLIGLGRPFCLEYKKIPKFLNKEENVKFFEAQLQFGSFSFLNDINLGVSNFWHQNQIKRISQGKLPDPNMNRYYSLTISFVGNYIWSPLRNPLPVYLFIILLIVWIWFIVK